MAMQLTIEQAFFRKQKCETHQNKESLTKQTTISKLTCTGPFPKKGTVKAPLRSITDEKVNVPMVPQRRAKRRKRDVAEEEAFFKEKMQAEFLAGTLQLKPGDVITGGIIQMMCVMCLVFFPRTTQFFNAGGGGSKFTSSRAGSESLQNSTTSPCKKCFNTINAKRNATQDGFVYTLLKNHARLTKEWFYDTLEKQDRRGTITNAMMNLTTNQSNCVGIHREDNTKGHVPENCFLEVQELNAPQHGGVIPNLKDPWICIFTHISYAHEKSGEDPVDHMQKFREEFAKKPKDLGIMGSSYNANRTGYDAKCHEIHFKTIFMGQIHHHVQHDIKQKRFQLPHGMSVGQLAKKVYPNAILQLESQHGCCFYTQIGMTHLRSWNQMSIERLDNKLPHFTVNGEMKNCVFICRIFNVARQLNKKMILEYFLTQKLVPVSSEARRRVELELGHNSST